MSGVLRGMDKRFRQISGIVKMGMDKRGFRQIIGMVLGDGQEGVQADNWHGVRQGMDKRVQADYCHGVRGWTRGGSGR